MQLRPTWPKGLYRKASALQALQQHSEAAQALQTALNLTQQDAPEVREEQPPAVSTQRVSVPLLVGADSPPNGSQLHASAVALTVCKHARTLMGVHHVRNNMLQFGDSAARGC